MGKRVSVDGWGWAGGQVGGRAGVRVGGDRVRRRGAGRV